MIKVIAFDLVGVLVSENDFELNEVEAKMERLFGKNYSDADFIKICRGFIEKDAIIIRTAERVINNIYDEREPGLFQKIKRLHPNMKIIIATNHISYVRNMIGDKIGIEYLDNLYISAELNAVKPESKYYQHILKDQNINPNELLFLDDSAENISGAAMLGIKTIKVNKDTNMFLEIKEFLDKDNE